MRLSVDHTTRYSYDQPVRGVVQSHRLSPTVFDGQSVVDWNVHVSDGIMGGGFRDGAGNWVQSWSVQGPISEITVTVRGTVETRDTAGILRGNRETTSPIAWLGATHHTAPDVALTELAHGVSGQGLGLIHAMSAAISEAVAFVPGATHSHTTAAEALALGEGVCQDHAHVLITCARLRDMPARYVSGYLFATADGVAHEAAHAWAEIYVEDLGWVGFDPANYKSPDEGYIRLCCGMDAREAAPIRGISRGQGTESMEIAVAVAAAQQ
jgi:transglutaminase-like putative cysteine protease